MDRQLLSRATDSSEAPTPGYMYVDLAKQATSNPATCQDMATYLTRRLQNKNNPNIKFKCCKVIAKLADQVPRNQFRRALAQNAIAVSAIKEAINFRGPLDAVQGDERNARVRTAAREALDAVYREAPSSSQPVSQGHMSASYGASPHGGGGAYNGVGGGGEAPGGAYNGAPSRMQGIGNPQFSDPRLDPRYNGTGNTTIKDVAKEAGEVILGMIKDPLAKNVGNPGVNQGHSGSLPGYGGGGNYGGVSVHCFCLYLPKNCLCCIMAHFFVCNRVFFCFICRYFSIFKSPMVDLPGELKQFGKREENGLWLRIAVRTLSNLILTTRNVTPNTNGRKRAVEWVLEVSVALGARRLPLLVRISTRQRQAQALTT